MKQCEKCGALCKRDLNVCPNCQSVDFLWSDGTVQRGQKLISRNEVQESSVNIYNDVTQTYIDSASETGAAALSEKRKKIILISIVSIVVVLILIIGLFMSLNKDDNINTERESDKITSDMLIGSTQKYGVFEQDNETDNGKESIEWYILEKENGKALLMSKLALENKPFNEQPDVPTDWEKSTLRDWLNHQFIDEAFSENEQKQLVTLGEGDNTDKVFILTADDADKYCDESQLICKPTEYVKKSKSDTVNINDSTEGVFWWLNTASVEAGHLRYVDSTGVISPADAGGSSVSDTSLTVRPCIWVKMADITDTESEE